ncbi:Tubulin alpha chain [Fasciola hepatica]|uniref:Tubulin alpha chain n=1 Tax=Fasciola hepatica TaxID=6192 RepID=A0A4E0RD40_FASHE|nr:Tubulin alpha chain [Fasciola hepatica]
MGIYRNLFDPSQLITGEEDSAANFARGYYRNAKLLTGPTLERLRHQTESCDKLNGFILHNAAGGGTGSSFPCALLSELQDQYSKCTRFQLAVSPSSALSSSTVEPYNALLGMHASMELLDCSVMMDNLALIHLCTDRLCLSKISMNTLNRVIAQITSGLLNTVRYSSEPSTSVNAMLTNLVPYPAVHFVTGALTPLRGTGLGAYNTSSCSEITEMAFTPSNQFLSCQADHPFVYLSCCLFYRGAVSVREVNKAIHKLKVFGQLPWVDWCPTGFKVAITHQPITTIQESQISPVPCSLLTLHNSTVMLPSINRLVGEFNHLYQRRAFVHWFVGEGMEEDQFGQALNTLTDLRDLYKEFHTEEELSAKAADSSKENRPQRNQVEPVSVSNSHSNKLSNRNYSAAPFTSDLLGLFSPMECSDSNTMKSDTLHGLSTTRLFDFTECASNDSTDRPLLSPNDTPKMMPIGELGEITSTTPCNSDMEPRLRKAFGDHQLNEKRHRCLKKQRKKCGSHNEVLCIPKKHASRRYHAKEGCKMRHLHHSRKKYSERRSCNLSPKAKENPFILVNSSPSGMIANCQVNRTSSDFNPGRFTRRPATANVNCCTVNTSTPEMPGEPSQTTYVYF